MDSQDVQDLDKLFPIPPTTNFSNRNIPHSTIPFSPNS